MSFINFNKSLTSQEIENHCKNLFNLSRLFMFIGVLAIALAILSSIIGFLTAGELFYYMFVFNVLPQHTFTIPIVIVIYLGLFIGIIGVPLYLYSLKIYALSKIANNSEISKY